MYIPKIVRVPIYAAVSIALVVLTIVLLWRYIGWLSVVAGLILFPIFNVFGGAPIDAFDLWLRRKTKDPIWLMTQEGRQWLETEEGKEWQKRNQGD
jgi:hypothetical protein